MKKVSTTEKAFIIGVMAVVSGSTSVLAKLSGAGAVVSGLSFGCIATATIALLTKVRK